MHAWINAYAYDFFAYVATMNNPKKNPTQFTSNSASIRPIHTFSGLGFQIKNPTQPTPFRRVFRAWKAQKVYD